MGRARRSPRLRGPGARGAPAVPLRELVHLLRIVLAEALQGRLINCRRDRRLESAAFDLRVEDVLTFVPRRLEVELRGRVRRTIQVDPYGGVTRGEEVTVLHGLRVVDVGAPI